MTDKIELKTCPFCGGKATCIEYYGLFHVICCECHIAGRDRPSIDGAIDAWNSRPIEDALKAENKRFKKYSTALEKEVKTLRDALTFYAKGEHLGLEDWQTEQVLKDDEVFAESYCETGKVAREALKGGAE